MPGARSLPLGRTLRGWQRLALRSHRLRVGPVLVVDEDQALLPTTDAAVSMVLPPWLGHEGSHRQLPLRLALLLSGEGAFEDHRLVVVAVDVPPRPESRGQADEVRRGIVIP